METILLSICLERGMMIEEILGKRKEKKARNYPYPQQHILDAFGGCSGELNKSSSGSGRSHLTDEVQVHLAGGTSSFLPGRISGLNFS
jgi:hypothetical protein